MLKFLLQILFLISPVCVFPLAGGRLTPVQTVQAGASPAGEDIIHPVLYDAFGRESIKTLPYTGTKSGAFRSGVTEATVNSYYSSDTPEGKEADSRAYSLTGYDNSPFNKVISQTGPGTAWSSKPLTINYLTNTSTKSGWSVTGNYSYSSFSHATNTLFITETVDEEGNYTREYRDRPGKIVLKESKLGSVWLRTAYIYDYFGLLRCIVPPEASGPEDTDMCYYYLYDSRQRMIEKKIPGTGVIKLVYDKRDRLRFSQNSMQAAINEWSFTKYDELNRQVITGILNNYNYGASALETATNNASSLNETRSNSQSTGYTNSSYPTSGNDVLTLTYYDNYDFFNITGIPIDSRLRSETYDNGDYDIDVKLATNNKGRITGSMTTVLSDATDATSVQKNKLYSTFYYDKYGNLLRSVSDNHPGGTDVITSLYEEITFQVTQTRQEHYNGSEEIILEKWFEYDHAGRLIATRQKVNDQAEITLNSMKYNEAGEMITKYLHSNQTTGTRSFIQKTDYQYNIRGWLSKINDPGLSGDNDMFGMQLFYNSTSGMGSLAPSQGLYNGNIAGIRWGVKNEGNRGFCFSYDNLSRMLQSDYAEGSSLDSNTGYFRTLNLPQDLDFGSNNRIFYHYTAGGAKLLKHSIPSTGTGTLTHYIGNIVYEGTTLAYILTDEGRLVADGTGEDRKFLYEYTIRDHLGNNRLTFMGTDLGGAVDIVQTTSYYPFGLVMNQMNGNTAPEYSKNKYLYNGKELQDENLGGVSLELYDFGFRYYDPQIGRFTTMDPLVSKYPSLSGYAAFNNNPIFFVDPDGKENLPALLWARNNMVNKGITSNYGDPWFGGSDNRWTYKIGDVPTRSVCYESCFISYMNSGDPTVSYLKETGFSNKYNSFIGRSTETGGINWFKSGDGTDRSFVTDINKGELGDMLFMGETGDMEGHAVLLNALPTLNTVTNADGTTSETMTLQTLGTSSESDPGSFGEREFIFGKQADGSWKQQGGAGYTFRGYGQLNSEYFKKDPKKEKTSNGGGN